MKKLIALRPVLYHAHQYNTGDSLPVNDPEMTKLWIDAKSAMWESDAEEGKTTAEAIPATAMPGMPGISTDGTDTLVGRIPETPVRKTAKGRPKAGTTKRKAQ